MFRIDAAENQERQAGRFPREAGLAATVHAPACSIWDVPEQSSAGALIEAGIADEASALYLAEARPLYDAAKRCIGQLSGVLLLLQIGSLDRSRDGLILSSAALQLREARKRLRALRPPEGALRHRIMLADLLALLEGIGGRLDRLRDLIDPASPDLDGAVAALFSAHRSLLAMSEPRAGLAPVDFTAACCNCRPKSGIAGASSLGG